MIRRLIATEKGAALTLALVIAGVVATLSYFLMPFFNKQLKEAKDINLYTEAKFLAEDALELGKYLLLYEKVIYVDKQGPLDLPADSTRRQKMIDLWSGNFSETDSVDLARACGGYDALGNYLGEFKLDGSEVFCFLYIRSSLFTGRYLEDLYFEKILASKAKLPFQKIGPGHYRLTLLLYDRESGYDLVTKNNGYLGLNAGQGILTTKLSWLDKISIDYDFFTDGSGFSSSNSKRYVRVRSQTFIGKQYSQQRVLNAEASFSFATPTPKLFSLFVPYPTKSDKKPTTKFSESVKINKDSKIYGKVFFNGDIDVPLADLPTFHDTVILTGDFSPSLKLADRELFRKKFKRGVVTHFSKSRYVMSGNCGVDGIPVFNQSGFYCKLDDGVTPFGISNYIDSVSGQCTFLPVTYKTENTLSDINCAAVPGTLSTLCSETAPTGCRQTLISGVLSTVSLSGPYAFIFATVETLNSSAKNIYGSIFGGHLNFGTEAIVIKSQQQWSKKDLGMGSEDTFNGWNSQANLVFAGITVPLSNIPLVYLGE